MAPFDPYHKWLGIPKDQRPPTLFQLLGISPDETDTEVIEEAAIRQTTHVRAFQIGPHAEDCKRVLNELSVARQVLVNPAKRKAYRELLAKQAGKKTAAPPLARQAETGVTSAQPAPPAPEWDFESQAPPPALAKPAKPEVASRARPVAAGAPGTKSFFAANKTMLIAAGTCGGGLIVAVVALLLFRPAPQVAQRENKAPSQITEAPREAPKEAPRIVNEPSVDEPAKPKNAPVEDSAKKTEPKGAEPPGPETIQPTPTALGSLPAPKLLLEKAGLPAGLVMAPDGNRVFGKQGTNVVFERPIPEWGPLKTHAIRATDRLLDIFFPSQSHQAVLITMVNTTPTTQVRLWDTGTGEETAIVDFPKNGTRASALPDGKTVGVFVPQPPMMVIYDANSAKELRRWPITKVKMQDRPIAVFCADGKTYISNTQDSRSILYLDLVTGEQQVQTVTDAPSLDLIAFSPDGFMMLARVGPGVFRQYLLQPFRPGLTISVGGPTYTNMRFSPDSRFALQSVTARQPEGQRTRLVMYDLRDGRILSASEPIIPDFKELHLAMNGMALARDGAGVYRVYQFPLPPDDPLVKRDPPKAAVPLSRPMRIPLPDPQSIIAASTAIRAQYKSEYAKKAPADNVALSEKFLQLGLDTADDMATRYVLFNEARDLAVKAGQPALALKVVGELSGGFEVDATGLKATTLSALAKTTGPANALELIETGLEWAAEKVAADQYEAAAVLVTALQPAAQRSKNQVLIGHVQRFEKQVKEMSKEFEEVKKANAKLEQDPLDSEASAGAGMFLALRKGDWDKGLMLLAQSKTDLEPLAKTDLGKPNDPKDKVELANAWWKAAEKKSSYQKAALQWRAGYWYRLALPDISGIVKDKAQERLKLVDEQPLPFISASALGEVQRLKHKAAVTWMTVALDGKRVYSSSMDGMIREWLLATGAQRVVLNPQQPIAHFSIAPDERHLALGSSTGFTFWDLATLKPVPFSKSEKEAVQGLYWKDATSILAVNKTSFSQWNINGTGNSGLIAPGKSATGHALVVSPKGDLSVILCDEGKNVLFNTAGGGRFPRGEIVFPANAAAFSQDSKNLALGGKDGTVRLYDTKNFASFQTFPGHVLPVRAVAIAPDGQRLLTGGDDKAVKVWDIATRAELHSYNLHTGPIRVVAFTTDGRHALSASMDGTIRMWSLPK